MTTTNTPISKAIDAKDKSLRQVMSGVQYAIDFYQRDYKWQTKQVEELLSDLTSRFLDHYKPGHVRSDVASYPSYFLGSIVLSRRPEGTFIVDGQQRLTTLTLLLIYLRNLQLSEGPAADPDVQQMIQSTQYGTKSFNMNVPERTAVIEALYNGAPVDEDLDDSSSAAIQDRYSDIESSFPEDCKGPVLPFFLDWLIERVQLVEISAYSDEDAYTVFETMNDRGLSLSPADMLKGYLLSNIRDTAARDSAESSWNKSAKKLQSLPTKESTNDFFRSWFRGRYALSSGVARDDYERIGPEFHRWLRDEAERIGLRHSNDFLDFVAREVPFFADLYWTARNNQVGFDPRFDTFYFTGESKLDDLMLLLAPATPQDGQALALAKATLVARYLDIFYFRRLWASKNLSRPALKHTFISLARDIRGMDLEQLTARLYAELTKPGHDDFQGSPPSLTGATRRRIHRLLARLTSHLEVHAGSGVDPYSELVVVSGRSRYDIEHIWPNKFQEYSNLFANETEFHDYRNRLGSLLLIPHSFNASYNDMPTQKKLGLYGRSDHHLLVASLASATYERNPRFTSWLNETGLKFRPFDQLGFSKQSSDERLELYRLLARQIWSPDRLIKDSGLSVETVTQLADETRDSLEQEPSSSTRSRSDIDISVLDLINAGLLEKGDLLVGRQTGDDPRATAIVLADGAIELETGERFGAPSGAAMALGPTRPVNGWSFWIHEASGRRLSDLRKQFQDRHTDTVSQTDLFGDTDE